MTPQQAQSIESGGLDSLHEFQRDAVLAQESAAEAARRVALWQLPMVADADIPTALDVPPSLWNQQKTIGDTPPLFNIGRRLFVRTADLREWLDEKAKRGAPGSKRLRRQAEAVTVAR